MAQQQAILSIILEFINKGDSAAKQALSQINDVEKKLEELHKLSPVKKGDLASLVNLNERLGAAKSAEEVRAIFRSAFQDIKERIRDINSLIAQNPGNDVTESRYVKIKQILEQALLPMEALTKGGMTKKVFEEIRAHIDGVTADAVAANKKIESVVKESSKTGPKKNPFSESTILSSDIANIDSAAAALKAYEVAVKDLQKQKKPDVLKTTSFEEAKTQFESFRSTVGKLSKLQTELSKVTRAVGVSEGIPLNVKQGFFELSKSLKTLTEERKAELQAANSSVDNLQKQARSYRSLASSVHGYRLSLEGVNNVQSVLDKRLAGKKLTSSIISDVTSQANLATKTLSTLGFRLSLLENSLSQMTGRKAAVPSFLKDLAKDTLSEVNVLKKAVKESADSLTATKSNIEQAKAALKNQPVSLSEIGTLRTKLKEAVVGVDEKLATVKTAEAGWTKEAIAGLKTHLALVKNLQEELTELQNRAANSASVAVLRQLVSQQKAVSSAIVSSEEKLKHLESVKEESLSKEHSRSLLEGYLKKNSVAVLAAEVQLNSLKSKITGLSDVQLKELDLSNLLKGVDILEKRMQRFAASFSEKGLQADILSEPALKNKLSEFEIYSDVLRSEAKDLSNKLRSVLKIPVDDGKDLDKKLESQRQKIQKLANTSDTAKKSIKEFNDQLNTQVTSKDDLRGISDRASKFLGALSSASVSIDVTRTNLESLRKSASTPFQINEIDNLVKKLDSLKISVGEAEKGLRGIKEKTAVGVHDLGSASGQASALKSYSEELIKVKMAHDQAMVELGDNSWSKSAIQATNLYERQLSRLEAQLKNLERVAHSTNQVVADEARQYAQSISGYRVSNQQLLSGFESAKGADTKFASLSDRAQNLKIAYEAVSKELDALKLKIGNVSAEQLKGFGADRLTQYRSTLASIEKELARITIASRTTRTRDIIPLGTSERVKELSDSFKVLEKSASQAGLGFSDLKNNLNNAIKNTSQLATIPGLENVATHYREITASGAMAYKMVESFATFVASGMPNATGKLSLATQAIVSLHSNALRELEEHLTEFRSGVLQWSIGLMAMGAAVAAPIKNAVSVYTEFSDTMVSAKSITNATSAEFAQMTKSAEDLGAVTRYTTKDAAEGLRALGMAGFSAVDEMRALPAMLDMAQAGALQVGDATRTAGNILTSFEMKSSEMGRVADVMTKAFTSSNSTLTELGDGFKYVSSLSKGLGGEFEDVVGSIAKLHDAGFKGTMAGTALRGALDGLFNPTAAEARVLEQLNQRLGGVGFQITNTEGKFVGFVEIVKQLEKAGFSSDEALKLFGQRAGPGMAALLRVGSAKLEDYVNKLRNAEGTATRIARTQEESLTGKWLLLTSATEATLLSFGKNLAVVLEPLISFFTTLVEKVNAVRDAFGPLTTVFDLLSTSVLGTITALGAFIGVWFLVLVPFAQFLTLAKSFTSVMLLTRNAVLGNNTAIKTYTASLVAAEVAAMRFSVVPGPVSLAPSTIAKNAAIEGVTSFAAFQTGVLATSMAKADSAKKKFSGMFADMKDVLINIGQIFLGIFISIFGQIKNAYAASMAAIIAKTGEASTIIGRIFLALGAAVGAVFTFMKAHPLIAGLTAIAALFLMVQKPAAVVSSELKKQNDLLVANQKDIKTYLELLSSSDNRLKDKALTGKGLSNADRLQFAEEQQTAFSRMLETIGDSDSKFYDLIKLNTRMEDGYKVVSGTIKETGKSFVLLDERMKDSKKTTADLINLQRELSVSRRAFSEALKEQATKKIIDPNQAIITAKSVTEAYKNLFEGTEKVRSQMSLFGDNASAQVIISEQVSQSIALQSAQLLHMLNLEGARPEVAVEKLKNWRKEVEKTSLAFAPDKRNKERESFGTDFLLQEEFALEVYNKALERASASRQVFINTEQLMRKATVDTAAALKEVGDTFSTLVQKTKSEKGRLEGELSKIFDAGKANLEVTLSTNQESFSRALADIEVFFAEKALAETASRADYQRTLTQESEDLREAQARRLTLIQQMSTQQISILDRFQAVYSRIYGTSGEQSVNLQLELLTKKKGILQQELDAVKDNSSKILQDQQRLMQQKKALADQEIDRQTRVADALRELRNKGKSDETIFKSEFSRAESLAAEAGSLISSNPELAKKRLEEVMSIVSSLSSKVGDFDSKNNLKLQSLLRYVDLLGKSLNDAKVKEVDSQFILNEKALKGQNHQLETLITTLEKLNDQISKLNAEKLGFSQAPVVDLVDKYTKGSQAVDAYTEALNRKHAVEKQKAEAAGKQYDPNALSPEYLKSMVDTDVLRDFEKYLKHMEELRKEFGSKPSSIVSESEVENARILLLELNSVRDQIKQISGVDILKDVDLTKLTTPTGSVGEIKVFDVASILKQFSTISKNADTMVQGIVKGAGQASSAWQSVSLINKPQGAAGALQRPLIEDSVLAQHKERLDKLAAIFKDLQAKREELSTKPTLSEKDKKDVQDLIDKFVEYRGLIKVVSGEDITRGIDLEKLRAVKEAFANKDGSKVFDTNTFIKALDDLLNNSQNLVNGVIAGQQRMRDGWVTSFAIPPEASLLLENLRRITEYEKNLRSAEIPVTNVVKTSQEYDQYAKTLAVVNALVQQLSSSTAKLEGEGLTSEKVKEEANKLLAVYDALKEVRSSTIELLLNSGKIDKSSVDKFDAMMKVFDQAKSKIEAARDNTEDNSDSAIKNARLIVQSTDDLKKAFDAMQSFTQRVNENFTSISAKVINPEFSKSVMELQTLFNKGLSFNFDDVTVGKITNTSAAITLMTKSINEYNLAVEKNNKISVTVPTESIDLATTAVDKFKKQLLSLDGTTVKTTIMVNTVKTGDTSSNYGFNDLLGDLSGFAKGGLVKIQKFATGGSVFGVNSSSVVPGEGDKDTVPAMLTPGEFVIKKSAVKKIGVDFLQALNSGKVSFKALGGALEGYLSQSFFMPSLSGVSLAPQQILPAAGQPVVEEKDSADTVNVALTLPTLSKPVKLKGDRDQVNALVSALNNLSKGVIK